MFYFSNINDHDGAATNETCEDVIWKAIEDEIGLTLTVLIYSGISFFVVLILSFIFSIILFKKSDGSGQMNDGESESESEKEELIPNNMRNFRN